MAALRGAASGTRNDMLNRAAFCLGQLDGAGRINTDGVRAELWDACAGYRADDGDEAARLTIASGWAAGKGSPLYRKPPLKGQTRSDRPASGSTPREGALGGYCLDGPSALGLEPLADARRLLDGYPDRLLVVLGAGRDGAREAVVYVLEPSGLWVRDPARLGGWHCEASLAWETRALAAAREHGWSGREGVARYLRRSRHPKGVRDCLDSLPALVAHRAEHELLPAGLTRGEAGQLDATRWLGAPNGVIDLHSGRLLPPEEGRLKLVTASLPNPYDPDATHPDVDRLTGHLPEQTAEWLWQQLAYCLHGQPARTFVAVTGPPGGGKSTLARAVQAALGPAYAGALGEGAITPQRGGRGANQATPDMEALMPPRRVVFSPEVENLKPDPARVKALTGGDLQTWRPLYGHPRHGIPTASLWLLGNQAPTGLGLTDPAMAERIRAVPYPEVPENEQVDGLMEAFDGNSAGARKRRQALVAKLVKLAAAQAPGWPPKPVLAVLEAVDRLREEDLGPVGVWLRDNVSKGDTNHVLASADLKAALWEAFEVPTDADRVEGMTWQETVALHGQLHNLGPAQRETTGGRRIRGWRGLTLTPNTGGSP